MAQWGIVAPKMEEMTMKKRIITVLLTLAVLMPFVACPAYAASDLLNTKTVYYTAEEDYIDGDCILTASRMMIRRAAIMCGKSDWGRITNESLRPSAAPEGLLLYSFCYEAEGSTYTVSCGSFSGESDSARIAEFENLLKYHPEGVVVWGIDAAETGTHGVLVTDVVDGEVYAMDSSYNMGIFSEGIQKWTDTTMLAPSLCTDYWYISDISSEPARHTTGETTDIVDPAEEIRVKMFNTQTFRCAMQVFK